jgi:hypothetical protein
MLLLTLFPWTLPAVRPNTEVQISPGGEGEKDFFLFVPATIESPAWHRWVPWLTGVAVLCSMSRGPQIALGVMLLTMAYFRLPKYRRAILLGVASVCLVAVFGRTIVLDVLHRWSNENHAVRTISIQGEDYEYTGTNHRWLQFMVYRQAMANTGLVGYGSRSVMDRPLHVPYTEEHLLKLFWSIDDHYIFYLLQAGFLGLGLFLLICLATLKTLWSPSLDLQSPTSLFTAGLFGAQLGVAIALLTVWFANDFGFQWMFNVGVSASLLSSTEAMRQPMRKLMVPIVPRRLVPGHPAGKAAGSLATVSVRGRVN